MKKMQKDNEVLNVIEHIILVNGWEYYVTDRETGYDNIKECLVMGFETEIGDVDLDEIKPFIRSRTSRFKHLMPAIGWKWIDEKRCTCQ